jgi:hypothetical protein
MRSKKGIGSLFAMGMLGALLPAAGFAADAAPAAKWYDSIAASGYLQASYTGNFNTPKGFAGAKAPTTGRQFDTDSNGFNFNTFLLQIAKPVGDSDHYGFTVRLRTGQDAQTLSGNNLWVQEAYVTYAIPSLTKLQLIGGKFVTSEGVEVVDTVNNPNFSEGLLFTFAEPITHTGIKANYTFSDKVNATVGLVNGWDVAGPDNNTAKTILWQVATTPIKQLTWSFQGLYGKEVADPTHSQRLSLDTVATYALMDKLSVSGQANWGQQSNDPATARGAGTTHWDGLGAWLSYATSSMFTESLRFEVLSDQNNASRLGGVNQTAKEITLTHKTMLTPALGTRLEYRHDWSNAPYFTKHDGSLVRNQNTISLDWFVLF